jgi:hypothetical protein
MRDQINYKIVKKGSQLELDYYNRSPTFNYNSIYQLFIHVLKLNSYILTKNAGRGRLLCRINRIKT